MTRQKAGGKYHIQPYHMNGLNWTIVPDDPKRDNIVIVTGFMPSWWTHEYGITFGADFHLDPIVHRNTLVKIASILRERFADLPNFFFSPFDYDKSCPTERRYGDAFIPALFGDKVSFDDASGHPYAQMLNLSDEQAVSQSVPEVENNPVLRSILDQYEDCGCPNVGEMGLEGVVNIGYRLRGQQMYIDLIDNPDLIDHIFDVIYQTINTATHTIRKWQDPEHTKPTYFINCNCLVNMMSPEMYRKRLLKFDKCFNDSFDIFGIHTCNWTVDSYLDAIAEIEGLGYLDMGSESDLGKVHKLLPDLTPSVFFHPEKLRALSTKQIEKEITELGKRIGRGYILFSDLEVGTDDEQIKTAYEAVAKL
ncbi:MAG: hypothetical protein ABIG61_05930 [Planctomycetota bacterium]